MEKTNFSKLEIMILMMVYTNNCYTPYSRLFNEYDLKIVQRLIDKDILFKCGVGNRYLDIVPHFEIKTVFNNFIDNVYLLTNI
jgi:hypothetical protein